MTISWVPVGAVQRICHDGVDAGYDLADGEVDALLELLDHLGHAVLHGVQNFQDFLYLVFVHNFVRVVHRRPPSAPNGAFCAHFGGYEIFTFFSLY